MSPSPSASVAALDALILAGGLGTRLQAVLPDHQKVVAPVHGRPFVERLLDGLARAGVRRTILCVGHQAEQVEQSLGPRYKSLTLDYSREAVPLGTAGALRQALPLVGSDPVLAMNGDSFCEIDWPALVAFHHAHMAAASLVVLWQADTRARGRVELAAGDRITGFVEKADRSEPGWISAGVYVLSRSFLESVPPGRAVSIERETFPAWVGRGLYAFRTEGKFLDIGTPASYAASRSFFKP